MSDQNSYHAHAVAFSIEVVVDQYAEDVVIHEQVYNNKHQWHDKDAAYWFQALVEEVGELGAALNGEHEHPPELELKQIGAISIGFMRQLDRLKGIGVGDLSVGEQDGHYGTDSIGR